MGRRRSCVAIDKEEQLAKIRKQLKPCANISAQVFAQERGLHANYSVYSQYIVTRHYSFTSVDQQEAIKYLGSIT